MKNRRKVKKYNDYKFLSSVIGRAGQTLAEYVLILLLIAIVVIVILGIFGNQLAALFQSIVASF